MTNSVWKLPIPSDRVSLGWALMDAQTSWQNCLNILLSARMAKPIIFTGANVYGAHRKTPCFLMIWRTARSRFCQSSMDSRSRNWQIRYPDSRRPSGSRCRIKAQRWLSPTSWRIAILLRSSVHPGRSRSCDRVEQRSCPWTIPTPDCFPIRIWYSGLVQTGRTAVFY